MSGNMNLGITSSSVLTTYPQTMTCIVDGTNIIQVDFYGNRQRIGVTQSAYDELEKISNEYYNKLVELKVITPPKTSEEIQQEQTQLMADMLKEMQNMKREIEVLKNDQSTNGCNAVSNCQVEKQGIIDSARTQYLIETTARQTQEQTMTGLSALGTKIDFYEYQNLRDQLAQERTKNVVLENRVYSDAKFNAVEAQLASISCRMLPKPDVTGIGAVCPNAGIINGLGINSQNGGCNMV